MSEPEDAPLTLWQIVWPTLLGGAILVVLILGDIDWRPF